MILLSAALLVYHWYAVRLVAMGDMWYHTAARTSWFIGFGTLAGASLITTYLLPGLIMRHLPVHDQVWIVMLLGVLAAAVFGFSGKARYGAERYYRWTVCGSITLGLVVGAISDAAQRYESAPVGAISFGGVVLIVALIAVGAASKNR
ncbi:hypothetical protein ABMA10_04135 [Plantibacter sp. RU18]